MGRKQDREKQQGLWVALEEIAITPGHVYYERLNTVLAAEQFDQRVEALCGKYYKSSSGRPSLTPGTYFRMLLVGYFEGIDSERGIAWRAADSLSLRKFLGYDLSEQTPDHSTVSRTRRLYSVETHQAVMRWVLKLLRKHGLAQGQSVCIDGTTLQANAAMKSLVRRDTGIGYDEYLLQLAKAEGIENPTREQAARLDRKRKKKASNDDWTNPNDPSARITKMKDGRTKLAHKAEHAVDLASGALLAVTLQPADRGDTSSYSETLVAAQLEACKAHPTGIEEVVMDKAITVVRCCWTWLREDCAATCRSRSGAGESGRASHMSNGACMRIGGACEARGGASPRNSLIENRRILARNSRRCEPRSASTKPPRRTSVRAST
ncbi:MAG: transposase [Acidobacteriota bacterium]